MNAAVKKLRGTCGPLVNSANRSQLLFFCIIFTTFVVFSTSDRERRFSATGLHDFRSALSAPRYLRRDGRGKCARAERPSFDSLPPVLEWTWCMSRARCMSVMDLNFDLKTILAGRQASAPGGSHGGYVGWTGTACAIGPAHNAPDLKLAGRDVAKELFQSSVVPSLIVTLLNRGFVQGTAVSRRSMAGHPRRVASCNGENAWSADRRSRDAAHRDAAFPNDARCAAPAQPRCHRVISPRERLAFGRLVRAFASAGWPGSDAGRERIREKSPDKSRRPVVAPSLHRSGMAEKACYVDI